MSDMKTLRLTASQISAVEIYVVDPAVEQAGEELDDRAPAFELSGHTLRVLVDDGSAITELIEAANSADEDGHGAGSKALMNLCRAIRRAA